MTVYEGARAFKIEAPEARSYQMMGTLWRVLGVSASEDDHAGRGVCLRPAG